MGQARKQGMKGWARGGCVLLALIAAATGCGGDAEVPAPPLTLTLAPSTVTVLVGSFVQFSLGVNATIDAVSFLVNDVEGGNGTVGTITSDGLYQAPPVVPADTTITIRVNASDSAAGTSATATATVTLDSGVRVTVASGSKFTIGTDETFPFVGSVTGVPATASISGVCDSVTNTPVSCNAVRWSVTGVGSIDQNSGLYTAPSSVSSTAATVVATSVYDTTRTAAAGVTIVTAADPTLTSISNTAGAVGAVHQDVYLTGSNFISTTNVFLNGTQVPTTAIAAAASDVLRVRFPDFLLTAPGTFTITAARQAGTPQSCSTVADCQLTLSAVRPALVGASPDSIAQPSAGTPVVDFDVIGGYFGTTGIPSVTGQFGGQNRTTTVSSDEVSKARQLSVTIGGGSNPGDLSTPGLFPVTITNSTAAQPMAVVNVAVQPSYPASAIAQLAGSPLAVGTSPSAVAINTATGIAVVANQGSHSIALVDLKTSPPTRLGFICTASAGATLFVAEPACAVSGPSGVAVDNLRNLALVANRTAQTVAVVSLATGAESVTAIIPAGPTSIADLPVSVGINPLSGRAIVAYQTAGFASLIDLKTTPPAVDGLVGAQTGATPHVAVSPSLNWALVTPGGAGSLALVDLNRQNVNSIASATCSGTTVTITTTGAHTLKAPDPVLVRGTSVAAYNGVFTVTGVLGNTFTYSVSAPACSGSSSVGTANYAPPVVTVATSLSLSGASFNDQTQKAILVDPTGPQAFIFSALDQTSGPVVTGLTLIDNVAAAFNPLANIAVVVNHTNGNFMVVDPNTPSVLANSTTTVGTSPVDVAIDPGTNTAVIANQGSNDVSIFSLGALRTPQVLQVSRQDTAAPASPISPQPQPPEVTVNSTLTTAATANPQTLTIIGNGFVSGTSVVRLDGTNLATTFVSSRQLTAAVSAAMLTAGPRRFALDVANGAVISNAASFTVIQSVDVSQSGCTALPQGVAIDSRRNLAVVSNAGCNSVAIINLSTGTGATVQVGTNPQGVATDTRTGLAVVANQGSNNASIVDITGNTVVATVSTDPGPTGVAIDPGLGRALVTASNANVVNMFAVSSTPGAVTSLAVQQRPAAIAIDPTRHLAAVANTTSNSVSLVDLTQTVATEHVPASGLPAGIAFDPVFGTFLVATSLNNRILVLDPTSRSTTPLRVGINPTSIAYNFAASTVVTTNSSSQTMTVVDFLDGQVRAVLSFRPSSQFAVDIHPFSNLAVIAESAGNKVVLRPLPR